MTGVLSSSSRHVIRRNAALDFSEADRATDEMIRKRFLLPQAFAATSPERTLLLLDDEENVLRSLGRQTGSAVETEALIDIGALELAFRMQTEATDAFDIPQPRLRLVAHGENTTFRVDATALDGRDRFLLRVLRLQQSH